MKFIKLAFVFAIIACPGLKAQQVAEWVSTSRNTAWQTEKTKSINDRLSQHTIVLDCTKTAQEIEGFGACFNELGWTSLSLLPEEDRQAVFNELFSAKGMNLTVNRLPIGSNDFSTDYYSYCDVEGDFEMKNFSIEHDEQTLIPFIQSALKVNPSMKLWASPWCPPAWMKTNKHYACSVSKEWVKNSTSNDGRKSDFANMPWAPDDDSPLRFRMVPVNNNLPEDLAVTIEGTDNFMQVPRYLKAYAKYFGLFIDAYKAKGINISMVMPQNEPNSAQPYPACLWSSQGLINFLTYLGPEMEQRGVDVFLGTIERADYTLAEKILTDKVGKYIKGCGFQWAGKDALPALRKLHPDMPMYQTEQECGNGLNNWEGAMHAWDLMKHYITNGVCAYDYWNISLLENGISRWGWCQNSLITVNKEDQSYTFTPDAYVLKHVSHYVHQGARVLVPTGNYADTLAFINADGSVVVVVSNPKHEPQDISINLNGKYFTFNAQPESLNTLLLK